MKMKVLYTILFLFLSLCCFSQVRYDANWVFGWDACVDFKDTNNIVVKSRPCNAIETIASISDSFGNLQFYISTVDTLSTYLPYFILDSSGYLIDGGDSINALDITSNGASIIPVPQSANQFYLFHLGMFNDSIGFYQSLLLTKIIWNKNTERFNVIEKNLLLGNAHLEQRMAMVRHADGINWWLFVHDENVGNRWYSFLISKDDVKGPFQQDIGNFHGYDIGCMTFSPLGNYMANAIMYQNTVELFDFNRCTGNFSNCRELLNVGIDSSTYSVAFSPNENFLYVTVTSPYINYNEVYQYTVAQDTASIQKRRVWFDSTSSGMTGQMQLAPDNKIYIAVQDKQHCCPYHPTSYYSNYNQYLWAINQPDLLGSACDFQPMALYLGGQGRSYIGLPNFPNFNLGPMTSLSIYAADAGRDTFICVGKDSILKGVNIGGDSVAGVYSTWQQGPGIDNIHQQRQVVYPHTSTWYYVTFTDTTIAGSCQTREDSVYVAVRTCVGIDEPQADQHDYRLIPNLYKDNLTAHIALGEDESGEVQIFSISGRIMGKHKVTSGMNQLDLSVDGLGAGVYFYKVMIGNEAKVNGKLVVVK